MPKLSPKAGKPADPSTLVDIPKLITAYFTERPDPGIASQQVSFGTSGHRGSSLNGSFNEWHILAIAQAICEYRASEGIAGPLFLGIDTHPLSEPAQASALEVLAANRVEIMLPEGTDYTPTPAISHAILTYNRNRPAARADGIVITPSHNPPQDGGIKYNPPHGGPAGSDITSKIQSRANQLLGERLQSVPRVTVAQALNASTTHRHNYVERYVGDLANIVDMPQIGASGIRLGVDPLGGAGVHYWQAIADRYHLNLTVVNKFVDPTFRFMTVDWDGNIRMDPSSPYAMQSLIGLKDRFDVAFACDTDHDRHGIVAKSVGLMPPNHYLSVCIDYLFSHRPQWSGRTAVGKTAVSSSMIDRVSERRHRHVHEVPVGFKWFVEGLESGKLGFAGEESAGAAFLRQDGAVWTTDKDGLTAGLLSAEITAKAGRDPGEIYGDLTREFGETFYDRIDAPANAEQKAILQRLSPERVRATDLAGGKITRILTHAPGDGNPLGGVKVIAEGGWFAARPSGTEDIYKVYAESMRSRDHLRRIQEEAQEIIARAFTSVAVR